MFILRIIKNAKMSIVEAGGTYGYHWALKC
jgi:hypothetical protein